MSTATVHRGPIHPPPGPAHLSRKARIRIACLRRRRDFLVAEIERDTFRDRDFDKQEVAALTWAIDLIEKGAPL